MPPRRRRARSLGAQADQAGANARGEDAGAIGGNAGAAGNGNVDNDVKDNTQTPTQITPELQILMQQFIENGIRDGLERARLEQRYRDQPKDEFRVLQGMKLAEFQKKIPELKKDGSNYSVWRERCLIAFHASGVPRGRMEGLARKARDVIIIDDGEDWSSKMAVKMENLTPLKYSLARQVWYTMINSFSDGAMKFIKRVDEFDADALWTYLAHRFKVNNQSVRLGMKSDFYGLEMAQEDTFDEFVDRILDMQEEMERMDGLKSPPTDEDAFAVLVKGVKKYHSASFQHILTIVKAKATISFDEAVALMRPYAPDGVSESANAATYKPGQDHLPPAREAVMGRISEPHTKNCYRFIDYGECKYGNNCKFKHVHAERFKNMKRMKKNVCESCGEKGHFKRMCNKTSSKNKNISRAEHAKLLKKQKKKYIEKNKKEKQRLREKYKKKYGSKKSSKGRQERANVVERESDSPSSSSETDSESSDSDPSGFAYVTMDNVSPEENVGTSTGVCMDSRLTGISGPFNYVTKKLEGILPKFRAKFRAKNLPPSLNVDHQSDQSDAIGQPLENEGFPGLCKNATPTTVSHSFLYRFSQNFSQLRELLMPRLGAKGVISILLLLFVLCQFVSPILGVTFGMLCVMLWRAVNFGFLILAYLFTDKQVSSSRILLPLKWFATNSGSIWWSPHGGYLGLCKRGMELFCYSIRTFVLYLCRCIPYLFTFFLMYLFMFSFSSTSSHITDRQEFGLVSHGNGTMPVFIMDSGATTHIVNSMALFVLGSTYSSNSSVKGFGGRESFGKVRGRVIVNTPYTRLVLENVLYVPDSQHNLISTSIVALEGKTLKQRRRSYVIKDGGAVVGVGRMGRDRLYRLETLPGDEEPRSTSTVTSGHKVRLSKKARANVAAGQGCPHCSEQCVTVSSTSEESVVGTGAIPGEVESVLLTKFWGEGSTLEAGQIASERSSGSLNAVCGISTTTTPSALGTFVREGWAEDGELVQEVVQLVECECNNAYYHAHTHTPDIVVHNSNNNNNNNNNNNDIGRSLAQGEWGAQAGHPASIEKGKNFAGPKGDNFGQSGNLKGPKRSHLRKETRVEVPGFPLIKLWHNRLCHLNPAYIKTLWGRYVGKNFDWGHLGFCEPCGFAKSHRRAAVSAELPPEREYGVGEKISSDVCGPVPTRSRRHNRYFCLFQDDKSRMTWVSLIKTKDAVFHRAKSFFAYLKTQFGFIPKVFHSDGGGEYTSKEFGDFLDRKGVEKSTTSPYNPNQNAKVERKNRTLEEASNAMLFNAGLPPSFWDYAVEYAVYIQNRVPHKSLGMKSPIDVFEGKEVDPEVRLRYVRTFGCEAFVFIPKDQRRKMEKRAKRAIFLGIDTVAKGWRFYGVESQKVFVARDVIFNESVYPWKIQGMFSNPLFMEKGQSQEPAAHQMVGEYVPLFPNSDTRKGTPPSNTGSNSNSDNNRLDIYNHKDMFSNSSSNSKMTGREGRSAPYSPLPLLEPVPEWSPNGGETEDPPAPGTPEPEAEEKRVHFSPRVTRSKTGHTAMSDQAVRNLMLDPHTVRRPNRTDADVAMSVKDKVSAEGHRVPRNITEARRHALWPQIKEAIFREFETLKNMGTWVEVKAKDLTKRPIGSMLVFDWKLNSDGTIRLPKARLVALGNQTQYGIDYEETHSATAQMRTFRTFCALATKFGLFLTMWDVKGAYLYGPVKKTIFMRPPAGWPCKPGTYYKLKKSLYGLPDAGRIWGEERDKRFKSFGMVQTKSEPCVWFHPTKRLMVSSHVDDILVAADRAATAGELFKHMQKDFTIKDEGNLKMYLGMRVTQGEGWIRIDQGTYIRRALARFNMTNCNPVDTPAVTGLQLRAEDCPKTDDEKFDMESVPYRALIGTLLYAALGSRPDIAEATRACAQFAHNPGRKHWKAAQRILKYLAKEPDMGIRYVKDGNPEPLFYTDSDWGQNPDTRKSVSGYIWFLAGAPVAWQSKTQRRVALSSCEAEFIACSEAVREARWLVQFLREIRFSAKTPITVYIDNQAAKALAENPVAHQRNKHIDIIYLSLRETVKDGIVKLVYKPTGENLADIFTKATSRATFRKMIPHIISK